MWSMMHQLGNYKWRVTRWVVERILNVTSSGIALSLRCTYGEVLRILAEYAGETGVTEGAVDVLRRIVDDRARLRSLVIDLRHQLSALQVPSISCKEAVSVVRNDLFGDGLDEAVKEIFKTSIEKASR
jgi:hypothetical protein